jgi:hypothetical protein
VVAGQIPIDQTSSQGDVAGEVHEINLRAASGCEAGQQPKKFMKIPSKFAAFGAALALLAEASLAQQPTPGGAGSQQPPTNATGGTAQSPGQAQQFFRASKLVGKQAKSAQGEDIGKVGDIVFNPQTGETFVLVDLGRKGMAPVPWQLINAGAEQNKSVVVNLPKGVLNSAPTVTEQHWGDFNDPKFTQRIDAYYGVTPTAVGAPGAGPGGTGKGSGQGPKQPGGPGE